MESNFTNNYNMCVNSEKRAKEIRIARLLLERIINRNYTTNALVPYSVLYKDTERLESRKDNEVGYIKLINSDDPKKDKMKTKCYDHSDYMEEQDIKYFFNFLSKHIKDWWD